MSQSSLEPEVLTEIKDAVLRLTLNRPSAMNAINDAIRGGLIKGFRLATEDPSIRAVLIRANGARAFCVGADIKETRASETPTQVRRRLASSAWSEAVASCPKPVIAAIQGFCFGGGTELALAADLRIASPGATMALPEIDLGLLPGGGGTQRLARLVGTGRALDLILTGRRVAANEALAIGLISRIAVSDETLWTEADALAQVIAAKPPVATSYIKEAILSGADLPLADGLTLERGLFTLLLSTQDRKEAATAFLEKRKGVFQGY